MAETKNYPLKKRPIQHVYVNEISEQEEPVDLCIKRVKYDASPPIHCKPLSELQTSKPISAFSFKYPKCVNYIENKYGDEKRSTSPQNIFTMSPACCERYLRERLDHNNPEYPSNLSSNLCRDYSVSSDYILPKISIEYYPTQFDKGERYSQPSNPFTTYPIKHNNNLNEQYHMVSSPNSLNSIGSPRRSESPLSTSSFNEEPYQIIKRNGLTYENEQKPPIYYEVKSDTGQRYQCTECRKSYSTYSGLTKHTQFHCPAIEGNQAKKTYDCGYCDKVYTSTGALKMHIRTHTLPCKCEVCGKCFSRPWLLQGHIRTHTGEKPFCCSFCNRAFADRSNLRAHLQTHSDVKKYSCTTCVKTFSRMSLLIKHTDGGCTGLRRSLSPQYL